MFKFDKILFIMQQPGRRSRRKPKGFNYKAHSKQNNKLKKRSNSRMKKAGGNLTNYKCNRSKKR